MLKIRRPLGRLIFNMGIAIPGKTVFLIETAPRLHNPDDWVPLHQSFHSVVSLVIHKYCYYPLNITFIFDRCFHELSDLRDVNHNSTKSKLYVMENFTKGALAITGSGGIKIAFRCIPGWSHLLLTSCHFYAKLIWMNSWYQKCIGTRSVEVELFFLLIKILWCRHSVHRMIQSWYLVVFTGPVLNESVDNLKVRRQIYPQVPYQWPIYRNHLHLSGILSRGKYSLFLIKSRVNYYSNVTFYFPAIDVRKLSNLLTLYKFKLRVPVEVGQYHGCWCRDRLRCQAIRNNDIWSVR